MSSFSDRFIYNNGALASVNIDTTAETQLRALSPELARMTDAVRRYSVLLKKTSISEIYKAITESADPRIGLVLAAARDNQGRQLFPSFGLAREFMFGITSGESDPTADVIFNERKIFKEGIERVSTALAAATIIQQLAQLVEQRSHSELVEKQALEDLDRILKVPNITDSNTVTKEEEAEPISFYFEEKTIFLIDDLEMYVYLSANTISSWQLVNTYTGSTDTMTMIADLVDYINQATLNATNSNIIASLVLAALNNIHSIQFNARLRDVSITNELVSVKFVYSVNELPFNWGIKPSVLKPLPINSLMVEVQKGVLSASRPILKTDQIQLNVLYIREKVGAVVTQDKVKFRVTPTMETPIEVDMPFIAGEFRPNQLALIMLDNLWNLKGETKALATIIRNDPPGQLDRLTGVELIAWCLTNPETWIVLDLIEFPDDLEVALGSIEKPLTPFSCLPRSLRVESIYDRSAIASIDLSNTNGQARYVTDKPSDLVRIMKDLKQDQGKYRRHYRDYDQYSPPNIPYRY